MADHLEDVPTAEQVMRHMSALDLRIKETLGDYAVGIPETRAEVRAAAMAHVAVLSVYLRASLDGARKLGVPDEALLASSSIPLLIVESAARR